MIVVGHLAEVDSEEVEDAAGTTIEVEDEGGDVELVLALKMPLIFQFRSGQN